MAQWQVDSSRRSAESELIRRAVTVNGPAIAADKPNDAQIAHIAYTASDLDVKAAEQALQLVPATLGSRFGRSTIEGTKN